MSGGMSVWMVVVVMRVTTLKATAAKLPGLLVYYAGLAEDQQGSGPARGPVDYYLDPEEPPGRWAGEGRAALGLEGTVTGDDLRSLLEGRHPVTGEGLGHRFGDKSAQGFDATFSAPKSVSVLWALSPDPWVRAEVLAAHDRAVEAALGWFERHGAVTRRGRDGVHQVDAQGPRGGGVPSAHVTGDGPAAPYPCAGRCEGSKRFGSVVGVGCPIPQVPATLHRRDLRRGVACRVDQPSRCGLERTRLRCVRLGVCPRHRSPRVLETQRQGRHQACRPGAPLERRA